MLFIRLWNRVQLPRTGEGGDLFSGGRPLFQWELEGLSK